MCQDYHSANTWTRLNTYDRSKNLVLWRLALSLKEGDKVKITFWGIDPHGKVICMI